jgi:Mor family transcriptional regulator
MTRYYLEEQYKSTWYAERNVRWYEEHRSGKPIKDIALDNLVAVQTVYRCIRRVKKQRLEAKSGKNNQNLY